MFTKLSVFVMVLILSACVSVPTDKRFKGTGDFDKVAAAKTRVSLGLTYLKNGNFSQAKFNLDKALEFDPRSGEGNFAMAFYYQQVDEVKRAHEYYRQAIDFSRDDPDVLNSYGAFLCKQGDYDLAKTYFFKAVDDKSYVSTAGTYENLAICAESQGLIKDAIEYFNSALNHQPTRVTSLLYLSQLYVQTEQWDLAKKTLWKYERNSSVTAESLWLSFQISRGQRDLPTAVEYSEILKRLYPLHPNTEKALVIIGKFRPGMTITTKTKPSTSAILSAGGIASAASNTSAVMPNRQAKNTKVLVESSSKIEYLEPLEKSTQASTDVSVDIQRKQLLDDSAEISNNTEIPFHIVKSKETLYSISRLYKVEVKMLLQWNSVKDISSISIGTKLWVKDPNLNE
jgi:type IV pilus assembly protein PilF